MKILWAKSWKINNNRKRYFHVTSANQIFVLLSIVQSDNEDEIDGLMKDSETEFVVPEGIEFTDNADKARVLTPEANIHIIDEGTKHTKELGAKKRRKKPEINTPITWKRNVPPHSPENCLLEGGVSYLFDESVSAFDIYEQVINLGVLIELLVQQSNLHSQQNESNFLANAVETKAVIGFSFIMAVNQLQNIPLYWDCDHFVGNAGIQNIFTRTRYQYVLRNLHFADNKKQDKSVKGIAKEIIDHLNESFQTVFSNGSSKVLMNI